ncbi:hypothetical protein FKP32DRAFT_1099172 [Trametes sanguinea]|nr:hypothetical protein FKP32DRAFT_1099172 [Trametes sanguinea]
MLSPILNPCDTSRRCAMPFATFAGTAPPPCPSRRDPPCASPLRTASSQAPTPPSAEGRSRAQTFLLAITHSLSPGTAQIELRGQKTPGTL